MLLSFISSIGQESLQAVLPISTVRRVKVYASAIIEKLSFSCLKRFANSSIFLFLFSVSTLSFVFGSRNDTFFENRCFDFVNYIFVVLTNSLSFGTRNKSFGFNYFFSALNYLFSGSCQDHDRKNIYLIISIFRSLSPLFY